MQVGLRPRLRARPSLVELLVRGKQDDNGSPPVSPFSPPAATAPGTLQDPGDDTTGAIGGGPSATEASKAGTDPGHTSSPPLCHAPEAAAPSPARTVSSWGTTSPIQNRDEVHPGRAQELQPHPQPSSQLTVDVEALEIASAQPLPSSPPTTPRLAPSNPPSPSTADPSSPSIDPPPVTTLHEPSPARVETPIMPPKQKQENNVEQEDLGQGKIFSVSGFV
ncbi:hypothetical protein LY78DRAFT_39031 [Colletotrichum sublineola]|nr:hypothetical protein LY78DRAFT_39031 [Colletotrichum sublineola]